MTDQQETLQELANSLGITLEEMEEHWKLIREKTDKFMESFQPKGGVCNDEDYYCACLNCGAVVLLGLKRCDDFLSQAMVDEKEKGNE